MANIYGLNVIVVLLLIYIIGIYFYYRKVEYYQITAMIQTTGTMVLIYAICSFIARLIWPDPFDLGRIVTNQSHLIILFIFGFLLVLFSLLFHEINKSEIKTRIVKKEVTITNIIMFIILGFFHIIYINTDYMFS